MALRVGRGEARGAPRRGDEVQLQAPRGLAVGLLRDAHEALGQKTFGEQSAQRIELRFQLVEPEPETPHGLDAVRYPSVFGGQPVGSVDVDDTLDSFGHSFRIPHRVRYRTSPAEAPRAADRSTAIRLQEHHTLLQEHCDPLPGAPHSRSGPPRTPIYPPRPRSRAPTSRFSTTALRPPHTFPLSFEGRHQWHWINDW